MKKFLILGCIVIANLSLADDTEIYGTTAIDDEDRVNSNVLFIMDTSGSMDNKVTTTLKPYDKDKVYPGIYDADQFYHFLYTHYKNGHNYSTLVSGCDSTIELLNNEGRVTGKYAQYFKKGKWNNWKDLVHGSQNDIRCNSSYFDRDYNLYSGNYMNYFYGGDVIEKTRLQTVIDVVIDLTHSLSNINLGLMRFSGDSEGGMIDVPVLDISVSGELIRNKLDTYSAKGATPLSETLYEGMLYMRGDKWDYGSKSSPNLSVDESLTDDLSRYKTPISHSCQKNHIILLTDGDPNGDTSSNEDIKDLISEWSLPSGLSKSCTGHGGCLDELAYWGRNSDHSSSNTGNQEITTYTIGGFHLEKGVALLTNTANWGGGKYFEANDTQGLTLALDSIFLDILSTDSTFTAPAVSVNAFNASEHRDELFYALFRPDDKMKWVGNVKRYRLTDNGIVVGANSDTPAISAATGFFNEGVFDYWNNSGSPDGKKVGLGGAANRLPSTPSSRSIYTETAGGSLVSLDHTDGASHGTYEMDEEDEDYQNVLDWTLGVDVINYDGDDDYEETRQQLGDPLHSEPVVITYGGTEENPDSTIFFGTNEGFIHAISTDTGQEQFAYLPRKLHSIQKDYYYNNAAVSNKPYGMDGLITSWFYDKNRNNLIIDPETKEIEAGEHIYLYAGMRRGGRDYYALDVSDRNDPELLFKIEGGITPGFEKLGQSWSKMTIAKVKYKGNIRPVLFFTGGYDENQDFNTTRNDDAVGNAIFMVDAKTGERLFWASNSGSGADLIIEEMKNSMPASTSVVDINGDGIADYLFAVDTGGRVFRLDFNPKSIGANDFAKGGIIASLSDDTVEGNRRFYNKPNVGLVRDKQKGDYLTIAVGSGHRAHPISTTAVENRFYLIKDFHPYSAPSEYVLKTEAATTKNTLSEGESPDKNELYNATELMTTGKTAFTNSMRRLMADGGGWYITFDTKGEKVLAESTTFAGAIIFTTFSPTGSSSNACGADTGLSSTYILSQKNAMSVIDLDGDGDVDENDSSKTLAHSGIAPRPVVIYRSGGGKTIAIGTETIDDKRFGEGEKGEEGCELTNSCPIDEEKICNSANCDVTPKYWREN